LFPHATGQWAKKIRGKLYYFGTDPDAALVKYLDEKDDRQAGRTPREKADELTVRDLCNHFLTSKQRLLDSGELSPQTWRNYYDACEQVVDFFGKERLVLDLASHDFERLRADYAKTRGPNALATVVQRVRTIFRFASEADLIDRPVRFGPHFRKPSRKALRMARQAAGSRMIEAKDLRSVLKAAKQPLKAMILLGLNCAFGQTDVANLPIVAIDFKNGWINFPRPKTAIPRRVPLWPETVAALRDAIAKHRPTPKCEADAGLVFVTHQGNRWVRTRDREEGGCVPIDSVNLEFTKLLEDLDLKRRGLGFYALRHIHRTIADTAKDQPAADAIMGHAPDSGDMPSVYREHIDDDRLHAVVKVVRAWLWPAKK
jgi:integrase